MTQTEITPEVFQAEVLDSELPVLVDVYSPSCRPCSAMEPTLKRIAESRQDRLKIVRLNSDGQSDFIRSLGVNALPTFQVYQRGRRLASVTGVLAQKNLEAFIDEALEPPKRSVRPPKS